MNELPPAKERPKRFSLSISAQLLIATVSVGAVAVVIAILGLENIKLLNKNLTETVDFLSTNTKLASLLKNELISATRAERNMLLAQSEDATDRFADVVDEVSLSMDDQFEQLLAIVEEENQQIVTVLAAKWQKWKQNHAEVRRFTAKNSDIEAREISTGDAQEAFELLQQALDHIVEEADNDSAVLSSASFQEQLLASQLSETALKIQRLEKDLILAFTPEEIQKYEERFAPHLKTLASQIDRLLGSTTDADAATRSRLENAYQEFLSANRLIRFAAGEKTNLLAYNLSSEIGAPLANECERLLDRLIARNEERMAEYRQESQTIYSAARSTLLGISLVGIFSSITLSYYMGHRIASRLKKLSHYAQAIHQTDDLSLPAPSLGDDEVGALARSFEKMRHSLYLDANRLNEQADHLADISQSLEAKNREMEQFIYTVSHDLKSPLVSCKGLIGLLQEDVEDEDHDAVLDSAARLNEAIDKLDQIIEDLLMLSRIGRKEIKYTEVDVSELLDELVENLEDRFEETDTKIEIQQDLPLVMADESDVRRVFENLLTNALKYAYNEAQPKITIGGSPNPEEIRYFVRDNGPGIDPQYHERIFSLFQRLETSQPGTGVGLASVAKIMSLHQGRAWVESSFGEGACFWLAFPRNPRLR